MPSLDANAVPAAPLAPGSSLPSPDRFRPRNGPPRRSRRARWRAAALIAVHLLILVHIAHWQIGGTTITPVEPSEAMETLELGYLNAGFLLLCVLILTTLVLGRFFCGWACHVVAYQDLCAWLLGRVGIRPRAVRSRLLAWVPAGAAFYMFAWPTLRRWLDGDPAPALSWQLTTQAFWESFPGPGITLLTFLVDGFLIVFWLGAKGFCTYGCPYGALFGLADRLAPGRIVVSDACETCGHCTAVCTSNVRVHEEVARFGAVVDPGCLKCMDCVSVCPKDALSFRVATPAKGLAAAVRRRKRRWDFSWSEELVMAAVFGGALYAFRGLYGAVPLLLAIGLAVLAAAFTVIGARLLLRPDLKLQHAVLRRAGGWTRAGVLTALGIVAGAAFVGHSAAVQYQTARGEDLADLAVQRGTPPGSRAALLAGSADRLRTAERWGLFGDARVQQLLGLVERERGEFAIAESHLRQALEHRPGWAAATVPLSDLLLLRGAEAEAEQILRQLLDQHPDLLPARQRLELLERRRQGVESGGREPEDREPKGRE